MSAKPLANSLFPIILFCLLAAPFFTVSLANEHGKRLFDHLMLNYNRLRRPADADGRLGPITVRLRLRLSQIIDLHEIDQIMTCSVWLRQAWADPRLAWKPDEYGGIDTLYVPHELIWVPDLILYNNADNNHFNVTIGTKATLHHTGEVLWEPPALFKSQCQINVQWFPFDEQLCKLKFGSWSYSEDILRLQFWDDPTGNRVEMEQGVDLSDYYPSVEWDIMSVRAKRHSRSYPGRSDAPAGSQQKRRPGSGQFTDIVYNLVLRRKPLFYTVNLVFPCLGISFLTILVFYLPSESGEKVALCISILVALTVFFLLLTEVLPATSIVLPLIGKYLLFTMFLVTLSVLITVISLNLHFRKSSTHLPLPRWLRRVFLRWLPKLLFMRRPRDAQAQLLEQEMRLKKAAAHRGGEEHEMGSEQQEAAERRRKSPNKTVAHLQERLQFDCLGPIRVLRDTPLDAMCRPPLDPRWKELLRLPNTVKAFEHICFIAELLKRKDRDLKVDQDWKYVANVLDRLFLVIFALGCFLGTAWILLQAPIFYDRRQPIDLMQFHPAEDQLQNGRGLAGL